MSRSGSGIQRWREERREKWPANYWKTLARRKGQDEWCAQNRRTLAEREAAFSILAPVFSFSMLCISTEPAPQAYPRWNVSAEKRHMPVHRCFFPSKYINKQPNKMARFAACLREDISNETHQSGPDFENMDDAVSLYRKFQGTLFNNRNILVMKSEKTHNLWKRSKNNGNLCISWMNRIVIQKTVLAVVEL